MSTLLIEISNEKAFRLLQDLEDLNIIKVIHKLPARSQKLSEKYAGKLNLSKAEYQDFQSHLKKSREEWNKNI